jgi:amidophosphoribosyltransferase
VIIVDDSIVRGTTCQRRVQNLKRAGAREVHVMISCPPHRHPCVYGIDFAERTELMAVKHSVEGIRQFLNADSVGYLSQAGMVRATGLPGESFCQACYDGQYPVPFNPELNRHILDRRRAQAPGLGAALDLEQRQGRLL